MTDQPATSSPAPLPPPWPEPTPGSTAGSTATPAAERLPHRFALFAVAAIVGLLAAIAVGVPIGLIAAQAAANDCSPSDGWCGLGAALAGFFVAMLVGGITYIVAGVAIIRRCRPIGRRAAHVVVHLAAPVMLALFAGITSNL